MNSQEHKRNKRPDKRFFNKNKNIKLYKEKASKINIFKKEVEELTKQYDQVNLEKVNKFEDLPLSIRTKKGLKKCGYFIPTEIQKETIMLSLQERDILGAAKTGSGKTLAFVLPLLERLYTSGWTILDGLGALIITPTRELAYQIFEVINRVGSYHQFSVGLIIGGKDLALEKKLLDKCNIMICTPGRLLQHMDQNVLFDAMNLKILILDEADKILDLGFAKTMNAILENLPIERQTLLFSATQTKSVKDLARLSLKNPEYVSVDENANHATPTALRQSYVVCEAHDKMKFIWSFIKSHKKQKILVFMASCKQVKFTFESICRLRPGVSIMALYGSLHQLRRMQIYNEFCSKNHVVMFATDIASRGLDFPNVSWVVQLDCPEDVNTYIHRAGRTARYKKGGESLLVLLPSEKQSMVEQLESRKIPIDEIRANPSKLQDIKRKLDAIIMRDKELKESGVRAFKAYMKNIFIMKDKSVFDVQKIDIRRYANSLGLDFIPRIRFLEKKISGYKDVVLNETSTDIKQEIKECDQNTHLSLDEKSEEKHLQLKRSITLNCDTSDESSLEFVNSDDENGISSDVEIEEDPVENKGKKILTKAALARKALKRNERLNTIIQFDEEGRPLRKVGGKMVPDTMAEIKKKFSESGVDIGSLNIMLDKECELDRKRFKERIQFKHRNERLKKREKRRLKNPAGAPPTLNDFEEESGDNLSDDADVKSTSASESDDDSEQSADEQYSDNKGSSDKDEQSSSNEEYSDEQSSGNKKYLEEDEQLQRSYHLNEADDDDSDESGDSNYENKSKDNERKNAKYVGMKRKKSFEDSLQNSGHNSEHKLKKKKLNRTIENDEELALQFLMNS